MTMTPSKNFCSQSRVLILDDRLLAKLMTGKRKDRILEILSGTLVAVMVFVVIAMVMTELGNYLESHRGAPRPGREASLPEYYSIEGARASFDAHHDSGLPRNKETSLWK